LPFPVSYASVPQFGVKEGPYRYADIKLQIQPLD
jgi:hypothetical protein